MDFPPLDDAGWDRLLGAVLDQRPTVGDSAAPLATPFPALPSRSPEHHRPDHQPDDASAARPRST